MIQNLSHQGYFTLRKCYFCYEIQKSLKDNVALNAALTKMVGEIEARWESDIFFKTNRQSFPSNEAIL